VVTVDEDKELDRLRQLSVELEDEVTTLRARYSAFSTGCWR